MTEQEYTDLQKMIRKANNRLTRLERYSGKSVSWAGKKLQAKIDNDKIGAWSTNDLIQISRDMSDLQLQRVKRATEEFLGSKASTITGVKNIARKTKRSLGANLDVTRDEVESLYQMLSDDTFKYIKEHSTATSSEVWALVEESKERRLSSTTFLKRMYEIAEVQPDIEMTENINALYMKEVLGV